MSEVNGWRWVWQLPLSRESVQILRLCFCGDKVDDICIIQFDTRECDLTASREGL
jgi:hypothetical protein